MADHVGFIGLGKMGRPMASRLLDAGYTLTVHDVRPESVTALTAKGAHPRTRFADVEPMLKHLGRVFFVGERPGMGQTMKLANNLLSATALAATSEAIVFGVKSGLDPATMIDVINAGTGRNSASQDK